MSCKVEGCNQPNYHYNPLITSFVKYHGKIVQTFDSLPKNGKAQEIAKRIIRVVVAPIAYLALGLTAIAGLIVDGSWKKGHKIDLHKAEQKKLEEQKKIEASKGLSGMINALGGPEKLNDCDILENWDGTLQPRKMTTSVMVSRPDDKDPFFLFAYWRPQTKEVSDSQYQKTGLYQLKAEAIRWHSGDNTWQCFNVESDQLSFSPSVSHISKGSIHEKFMLERIARLMKGQPVGMLQRYKGMGIFVPEDKSAFKPEDSHLKGKELEEYMTISTLFYEAEVEQGTTDLFLHDPKKPKSESLQSMLDAYPKMNESE